MHDELFRIIGLKPEFVGTVTKHFTTGLGYAERIKRLVEGRKRSRRKGARQAKKILKTTKNISETEGRSHEGPPENMLSRLKGDECETASLRSITSPSATDQGKTTINGVGNESEPILAVAGSDFEDIDLAMINLSPSLG